MTQATICLIIFALTIVCYMLNKWPLALVSMTSLLALTVTGCLTPEQALSSFSNNSVTVTVSYSNVDVGSLTNI